jgi:hypothetical protein
MGVEYRWYEGDLESVEKNKRFLTDESAIKEKIPQHLRGSSRWGGHLNLSREAQNRLIVEFITALDKHYGGSFQTDNVEKIRVCMDSSAGKPWKKSGIAKKKDFYGRRQHEYWLSQYIEFVHCFNWRENFSAAPKGELTEKEDIANKKSRVFYVAGVLNDYYVSDICKDFNAAIKRMAWNSVGEVWQYGGFNEFGEEMDNTIQNNDNYVIEESDCSKYDLTCVTFFFRLIVMMRCYFSKGHGYENLRLRLEQLYHQALEKDLIWFDGSVFKTERGNPSGWKNTTEDNCIRHLFIRWYHFTKTMNQDPDYFWTKVFLRVYSDDSVCIADRQLLDENDLNASYTFWNTVYKGYVKPLTRDISDTTYLGAVFKKGVKGITYTIARQKAFWSMCVENRKLTPLEIKNRCETIASLVANDDDVLEEFLKFISPYGIKIDVGKARFIAGGLRGTCMDFSQTGFSSGCVNHCREAPSSGFKEVAAEPNWDDKHTQILLPRKIVSLKMGATKAKKAERKKVVAKARDRLARMEVTQTRNTAIRKALSNAVVTPGKRNRINWYLIELLDPSRWEEAIANGLRGIPDFYSHKSHVFPTRTVEDLDASNFDADGKCFISCGPSMVNHLKHTSDLTSSKYTLGFSNLYSSVGTFEYVDTNNKTHSLPTGIAVTSTIANLATFAIPSDGELSCETGSVGCKSIMAHNARDIDGPYSTGYYYNIASDATNNATCYLKWWDPTPGAGTIEIEVITNAGTRVGTKAVGAGSHGSFVGVTLDAADTEIRGINFVNKTGASIVLNVLNTRVTVKPAISSQSLNSHPVQNYTRIAEDFQAVRPICGYMWIKYRGSLTANGSIAGALIDSIQNPVNTDVMDYEQIAGLAHAHEGSVVEGSYTIWCPMNPNDTNFTPINDQRLEAPYIVAGLDVNDLNAQSIRVECYWVWEGLTQQQMYATEAGSVDVEMMNDAFGKLAHFNKSMENDLHLKAIAQFLGSGIKKGIDFVRSVAGTPAGKAALMSAAQRLLSKASEYGPTVANAAKFAMNAAAAL